MSDLYLANGRRKESVARVQLKKGKGEIKVNSHPIDHYFKRATNRMQAQQALKLTNHDTSFDINIKVAGGGASGQAGAIKLGISRALIEHDSNFKKNLKKDKLTTRGLKSC